jgi:glutaconate CoA-transferase, subunit A
VNAADLAARIPDGAFLAMPPDYSMPAMEVVRCLIRQKSRRLRLLGVPVLGMCADMLIGAGCVAEVESSAVSLGEAGLAPRFSEAVEKNVIRMNDATCPAIHTALQASEKGVPFMPLRGLIGSDVLAHRGDWRVVDNPFGADDPIVLVPALKADAALFHAAMADRAGNVWIGRDRDLVTMAHAADKTIVTVETLHDGNLLDDPLLAAGTLAGFYLEAVAVAPRGAWPLPLADHYPADAAHLAEYARLAASAEGFARYLERHVHAQRAA